MKIPVYDADSMAKSLMEKDIELIYNIKKEFGSDSYENGKLNRQFLAERVFKNTSLLAKLNAMVHPAVARDFSKWTNKFSAVYILKEAALLFETGSYRDLDFVILVESPLQTRIERIKNRDPQRSSEQIMNIIEKQIQVEEARELADFVIYNDESHMLIPQVLELQEQLIKKG